jgi:hypothetical protein
MKAIASLLTLTMPVLLTFAGYHAPLAYADTFGSGANQFDIQFVRIGNPDNPADPRVDPNPAGKVEYAYRIGKYEVSRDMITKANTLGSLGITLEDMTSYGGNGVDRPATGVSWNEAARFVNWLNTSTGFSPAYKFALQPGDVGYSANAFIQLWTPSDAGYNPNNLFRNSLAFYFLPSVDEWHKAAYYDPTSGSYFVYPTGSNSAPTPVASGTAAGTAVYSGQSGPANITLAGGLSPYGTMGQGGNVYEWEETEFDLMNDSSSSDRGARSGYWDFDADQMAAWYRDYSPPTLEGNTHGFRVASVPEPSALLLGALAAAGLLVWRRR